jgi:hypothetical protein
VGRCGGDHPACRRESALWEKVDRLIAEAGDRLARANRAHCQLITNLHILGGVSGRVSLKCDHLYRWLGDILTVESYQLRA